MSAALISCSFVCNTDKSKLVDIIADGLSFFQQMRKKGVPLVAAIDGPALGGGLEWALWCDYRICTDNPKTKVGPKPSICYLFYERLS